MPKQAGNAAERVTTLACQASVRETQAGFSVEPQASPLVVGSTSKPSPAGVGKQRAKTKKQSGLQALLAKNRANASAAPGSGFDLMDFMKTA